MSARKEVQVPAIEVTQSAGRTLYMFAIDGKVVPRFATVSRVRRPDGGGVEGYQRPEVLAHIDEIRTYVESEGPMIPNAVVVAFDDRVRFESALPFVKTTNYTRVGTLTIPLDSAKSDADKPGFIVDGQQRLAAIRDADVDQFPMCVTAFITGDVKQQTEQFILINSTKPLPKALIYELLPGTQAQLPSALQRRRFPAFLLDRLNRDEGSSLRGRIQTPTTPGGLIKDNSILRMLENSLSDGALYRFRSEDASDASIELMVRIVSDFWAAASQVFSSAWDLPPKKSRLMHGAGIVSLGFVMDAITSRLGPRAAPTRDEFLANLQPLKDVCHWTDGYWEFGPGVQRRWNELQNTTRDVQLLSNYLLAQYKQLVWR